MALPPEIIPEKSTSIDDPDTRFNKLLVQKKTPVRKVRYFFKFLVGMHIVCINRKLKIGCQGALNQFFPDSQLTLGY